MLQNRSWAHWFERSDSFAFAWSFRMVLFTVQVARHGVFRRAYGFVEALGGAVFRGPRMTPNGVSGLRGPIGVARLQYVKGAFQYRPLGVGCQLPGCQ